MRKRILIIIIVILTIILVGLFIFKSCSSPTDEEQNAFINANIEMTCLLKANPKLTESPEAIKPRVTEIYRRYGLPTENNEKMIKILNLYENNENTGKTIKEYSKYCENGSPKYLFPEKIE